MSFQFFLKNFALLVLMIVLGLSSPLSASTLTSPHQEPPDSEDSLFEPLLFTWEYIGYVYKNQFFTPLDPELKMRFSFESEKHVRLSWETSGGAVRCARVAEYEIRNNIYLWQKNIWVDPKNHSQCSSDKDMTMGYESTSIFQLLSAEDAHPDLKGKNQMFQLTLSLADEEVKLLFEKKE